MTDEQHAIHAEFGETLARLDQAKADGDIELDLWILEGLDHAGYFVPDEEVQPSAADTLDAPTNSESQNTSTSTVTPFPTSGRAGT